MISEFISKEIIIAGSILIVFYGVFLIKTKKRISRMKEKEYSEDVGNITAPYRSRKDYNEATDKMRNSFSNVQKNGRNKESIISEFGGSAQFEWNGQELSIYGGKKILSFDGKFLSDFAGNRKYIWENNCLSQFGGKKLYKVSENTISKFAGAAIYRFDKTSISIFGGRKIYNISGEIPIPIIIVVSEKLIKACSDK